MGSADYTFFYLIFAFAIFMFVLAYVLANSPVLIEHIKNDNGAIVITIKQKKNGMFLVYDKTNGRVIRFTRFVDIEAYVSRRINGWKLM